MCLHDGQESLGFEDDLSVGDIGMACTRLCPSVGALGCAAALALFLASFPVHARERLSWDYSGYDKLEALFTSEEGPLYGEKQSRRTYHLRFVVEGESLEDWTEILEIIDTYRRDEPDDAQSWFRRFQAQGNETCPSEWTAVDEQTDSIIFRRTAKDCREFDDQDALYRILYGKENVFLIFATLKGELDAVSLSGWLNVLRSAEIRE
jgi:hypothetical protein